MRNSNDIFKAIHKADPTLEKSDAGFNIYQDRKNNAWVVDYHDDKHHLRTFIEEEQATECLDNDRCIPLGLQLGQLKHNFEQYKHEHAL